MKFVELMIRSDDIYDTNDWKELLYSEEIYN